MTPRKKLDQCLKQMREASNDYVFNTSTVGAIEALAEMIAAKEAMPNDVEKSHNSNSVTTGGGDLRATAQAVVDWAKHRDWTPHTQPAVIDALKAALAREPQ